MKLEKVTRKGGVINYNLQGLRLILESGGGGKKPFR